MTTRHVLQRSGRGRSVTLSTHTVPHGRTPRREPGLVQVGDRIWRTHLTASSVPGKARRGEESFQVAFSASVLCISFCEVLSGFLVWWLPRRAVLKVRFFLMRGCGCMRNVKRSFQFPVLCNQPPKKLVASHNSSSVSS